MLCFKLNKQEFCILNIGQEPAFIWLSKYAYQPNFVYLFVFIIMLASGFGLPIPEEVTIVSVGILAYMGAHPETFPPPHANASVVNGYEAAAITFLAVIFTDALVFYLGRNFGRKLMDRQRFKKVFSSEIADKIQAWLHKYGIYATFGFRFMPGLRFPAHIFLGMSEFPAWQFIVIDGIASLISIPTQILLIYHFGQPILKSMHKFKQYILAAFVIFIVIMIIRKYILKRRLNQEKSV